TREDDIMVKLVPSEDTTSGVKQEPGPLLEAALISKRQPVILLIDEWDKTSPSADSFMLTFMQDGWLRYNGYRVRANLDNIIFFFAMNDQRELEEPFKRRLAHIEFTELPLQVVAQALVDTHPESEFIKPAVALYARSLMAK